jgi:hypothetical protein
MELGNIIISDVSQAQKAKNLCPPSYADYRPKTNAVILLDMGQTPKGHMHGRNKEREGNLKFECS